MEWPWASAGALDDDLETLFGPESPLLLDFAANDKALAAPQAATGLRCLDASHAAGCTLCVPLPRLAACCGSDARG